MPPVKKQTKKSNNTDKHIKFIYKELEDLRSKLEKISVRMGL